jgi:tryptophan halogenase
MSDRILIAGGGTAGWLTACYLARTLNINAPGAPEIVVVESPEIGIIGVGEGTFPTIRATLQTIGIDEARFLRESNATFKQGIRFEQWVHAPEQQREHYFHPFEFPHRVDGADMLPFWLRGDAGEVSFGDAVTIQKRVADAALAPKRAQDAGYRGPLNYAYHFDAARFAALLMTVAKELGVRHIADTIEWVRLDEAGAISGIGTRANGALTANLYVDCTGFKSKLIGEAMGVPFRSCRETLFANAAVACQVPNDAPGSPIASYTIATAQEAGWTWDIGLNNRRGVGYVYSRSHLDDDKAEETLRRYLGPLAEGKSVRHLKFDAGYRERQWVQNCVGVGLSGAFFEPLESTGIMLIEVAASMIAEFYTPSGDFQGAARRFNDLMVKRCSRIVNFLKMHYCLSRRPEPFWVDNRSPASIRAELATLLETWSRRPPSRFDFVADYETFPYFSYQYVLYGMGFRSRLEGARSRYGGAPSARNAFAELRRFGEAAVKELPSHRALIEQIYREGFKAAEQGAGRAPSVGQRGSLR